MPGQTKHFRAALIFLVSIIAVIGSGIHSYSESFAFRKSQASGRIPVNIIEKIPLPRGYHEGLYSASEGVMWVINGEKGDIWAVDTGSGKVVSRIMPFGSFTEAVTLIPGGALVVTDWDDKKVYTASIEAERLKPGRSASVKPAHPAGAVWAGNSLFVIAWTRGLGTKFDLMEFDKDLSLIRSIPIHGIQDPAHLAWDGNSFWITSWYDPIVYKVSAENFEILGSFRSPVSKTTGIAWDGRYLWLTGTYSDLYKIAVAQSGRKSGITQEEPMKLSVVSSAFREGEMIPSKYTCDGEDMSPPVSWTKAPAGTGSIVLISDDPDAPMGTWVHWVMVNIPPEQTGLDEGIGKNGTLASGAIQGMNDSGEIGYGGPCPPNGTHRYFFKIYALDTTLDLKPGVNKTEVEMAMEGHILAEGQLMGRYKRQ